MTDSSDAHTDMPSLTGKVAAITGGTTGIGRAIAILLASEGVRVFIAGRDEGHLADALADIRAVGEGDGLALDFAEGDNAKRFVDQAKSNFGRLDIVVVNAAISAGALSETSQADLRYAIATDFTAYLLTAHAAVEALGKTGDIVFIGSMSAHVLGASSTIYAGIKYGIQGFSEALRRELGPKGIRVSNVEPGLTGSDMQYPETPADEQRQQIAEETMLRAEDIAVAVHYILTQPNRAVVQQLTITPRGEGGE